MKRIILLLICPLLFLLSVIVSLCSCSNDLDISEDLPKSIGLSAHEIEFSTEVDSIALTAPGPWFIEHICDETTKEYVYRAGQTEGTKSIGKGALRGTEIQTTGLIIRKFNDHHIEFIDNGMLPTDTFSVFCRLAPFNHYSESIMITKRKE